MTPAPAMMRAAVVHAWQVPAACAVESISTPQVKAGEVLFAVDTAAINFGDTLIMSGRYQVRPDLPFVGGRRQPGSWSRLATA